MKSKKKKKKKGKKKGEEWVVSIVLVGLDKNLGGEGVVDVVKWGGGVVQSKKVIPPLEKKGGR